MHTRFAALILSGLSQLALADSSVRFDVPAQPLADAVRQLAAQSNTNIFLDADIQKRVEQRKSVALSEELTLDAALTRLLQGTGVGYRFTNEHTVVLEVDGGRASAANQERIRVAQADASAQPAGSTAAAADAAGTLEEIVVTAQKREQRLQDVPVPVTVLSGTSLVESNQLRIQDYYTRVPGLSVAPSDFQGTPVLAIRGVATGSSTNPTVGIVVDDVPYGSSTVLGGGAAAPDFDPSDLQRVEVLRGPQGTLYGASSIGGLLKFVTVDPSTEALTGRVQGGLSSVAHGNDAGHNVRAAINIPLSDAWAIRASGFTRRDPGYIDDPSQGRKDVNQMDVSGGRLSTLWKPSQDWSLKLSAQTQDIDLDGSPEVHAGLGDFEQSMLIGTGGYDRKYQTYSATLAGKLGAVNLTSLTGYNVSKSSESADLSYAYGGLFQSGIPGVFDGYGVSGAPFIIDRHTKKFSQEIRLSAPVGERFEWLFGAFYTHEDADYRQHLLAVDPATGATVGVFQDASFPTVFSEYAAFADLTFHLTDRFDLQVGGRESRNRQNSSGLNIGPLSPIFYGQPSPFAFPRIDTKDNAFTYLVTPQFRISENLMTYARLASGYRVGGPNINGVAFNIPTNFKPDKTLNYEIGLKGDGLDHRISFDASVYYIDWKDIQLTLFNGVNTYLDNASRAKSQGVELSVEARPLAGLAVAAWVAWNDAELKEGFPSDSFSQGEPGDRLPYSSRFSGNLSVDYDFTLSSSLSAFVGGSLSYVGKREGIFVSIFSTPERQNFSGFTQADLRAGVRHDSWTFSAFASNVTDKRTALGGGIGTTNPNAFQYIQPRTLGLTVAKSF